MGAWLDALYADRSKFEHAIERVCLARLQPCEVQHVVNLAQTATCNELFVSIQQLDFSVNAKHGCYLEKQISYRSVVLSCDCMPGLDINLTFFFGFFGIHSS